MYTYTVPLVTKSPLSCPYTPCSSFTFVRGLPEPSQLLEKLGPVRVPLQVPPVWTFHLSEVPVDPRTEWLRDPCVSWVTSWTEVDTGSSVSIPTLTSYGFFSGRFDDPSPKTNSGKLSLISTIIPAFPIQTLSLFRTVSGLYPCLSPFISSLSPVVTLS